ncbi:Conserved hypothetical protein [gamma proteobacterium HdN1]|nr:Conserved hypothetical protein [gamma proteobacterium HdN1]
MVSIKMSTIRFSLHLLLLMAALLSGAAHALVLDAEVDTTEVRFGETLQLTLKIDDSARGNEPDLSVLDTDFRVLGRQTSSSTRLSNRGISSETRWLVTLLPRKKGEVTIPAIPFDGVTSKPINITVTDQPQPSTNAQASDQQVFLQAEVDSKEVYVQQQVNFTLRLYKRGELLDPNLSMPDVEGAVQEKLGAPRSFRTVINGQQYDVVENRFAFFPQKSGTFLIPPAELTATVLANSSRFYDPFSGTTGKQIRRTSDAIEIHVRPKPASYPKSAPWLPTTSLKISETLTPNKTEFKVGEPITRVVTIDAAGVAPSLLPPLPVPEGLGYKVYAEPAETKGLPDAKGVSSRREETHSYIPTRAGTLKIPPVEIAYWNLNTDHLDKATLPGRELKITAVAPAAGSLPSNNLLDAPPNPKESASNLASTTPTPENSIWPYLSAALLILWLATLGIIGWLWQKLRQSKPTGAPTQETSQTPSEKALRKQLLQACSENHPFAARKALVGWFAEQHPQHAIHSLGHIRQHAMSALLASATTELEQVLYNPQSGSGELNWSGERLRKAIADEDSQRRIKVKAITGDLASLYPSPQARLK